MPNEDQVPGTQLTNIVRQKWAPGFALGANEELVIGKDFDSPDGVQKFGNTLNISQISAKSAQTLAATDTGLTAALTYANETELNVTGSAQARYCGVQLPRHSLSRVIDGPALQAGYRKQLMAAVAAAIDVY